MNNNNNDDVSHNVPPVDSATITRTTTLAASFIFMAFTIVNQYLTANGHNPIAIDESTILQIVSYVCGLVAAVWAWWKPNHFTQKARETYTIAKVLQEDKLLEEAKKKYVYSNGTVQKLADTLNSVQASAPTATASSMNKTTDATNTETSNATDELTAAIQQLQK